MSKMSIGKLRSIVLLGALALVVMVGTGVYAASANISADKSISGQNGVFDPFNLKRTTPDTLRTPFRPVLTSNLGNLQTFILLGEPTTLIKTMPTVRIPVRPLLRSNCGFISRP